MKFIYLLLAIVFIAVAIFSYRISIVRKETLRYEGGFKRDIKKTYSINNAWNPIPHKKKLFSNSYAFIDESTLLSSQPDFYFIRNGYPLSSRKDPKTKEIVFANIETQDLYKSVPYNNMDTLQTLFKLPFYTFRICIDSNKFFTKSFDFKTRINSIHYLNSKGNVIKSYTPFEKADDGGLSSDGFLLSDDSCIYYVSEYSNKLLKINFITDSVYKSKTIEKIDDYPAVVKKYNKSYSFAKSPFLAHYGTLFVDKYLVVLSGVRDQEGLSNHVKSYLYFDLYSKKELVYQKSFLIKNINAIEINDIKMSLEKIIFSNNESYTVLFLK